MKRGSPEYVVEGDSISAMVDQVPVGTAVVGPPTDEPGVRQVTLRVEPGWQRRGIGTRLLVAAARLAHSLDATEIMLTTRADNQAVLPMVLAAGLRSGGGDGVGRRAGPPVGWGSGAPR